MFSFLQLFQRAKVRQICWYPDQTDRQAGAVQGQRGLPAAGQLQRVSLVKRKFDGKIMDHADIHYVL